MSLLTSGAPSTSPTELLNSKQATQWFALLRSLPDFDVILVDNPPALVAIDAFLVASETEGSIIMVMRSGKTRGLAAKELRMSLERLGLKLRGVIMNDVPAFELGGYYSKSLEYYRLDPARKK